MSFLTEACYYDIVSYWSTLCMFRAVTMGLKQGRNWHGDRRLRPLCKGAPYGRSTPSPLAENCDLTAQKSAFCFYRFLVVVWGFNVRLTFWGIADIVYFFLLAFRMLFFFRRCVGVGGLSPRSVSVV